MFRNLLDFLKPEPIGSPRRRRESPRRRPSTWRPSVEALENRNLLAAVFSVSNAEILEGNEGTQNAAVVVRLSAPSKGGVTVNYSTANGTAIAGSDYTSASGKLTFAKGESSKTVLVPVRGDCVVEADEYFRVQLSNPTKGTKIGTGTGYVTITDNEPHVSIYDVWASEGNAGTTPFTFTVWLSQPYDLPVTVNYTTSDGSASAESDYTASSGTLTFAKGETSKTIAVAVNGDRDLRESNETFLVSLSTTNSFAAITRGVATGVIVDDEPQISIADAYNYGETSFTFTVSLAAAYDQVVSVDFATVNGAAIAGEDYVAAFGTLTFTPGETTKQITVEVIGDVTSWGDKWFIVQLSSASNNAALANETAYGYYYAWYDYGGGYDYGWYDYGYYYY